MLAYPVILAITSVSVVVVGIIVWLVSGSLTAFLVVLTISGLVWYIVKSFGVFKIHKTDDGLNVDFHENAPAPHSPPKEKPAMQIKEVFYVSGDSYTYNDAPAVCAAYGSELASYDQLMEAFSLGAEWCGYGWSAGGMALFPTQESTWSQMQMEVSESKRTACGRPGINGGYFDPKMKFGVNCYGNKPANMGVKLPLPLAGTDTATFDKMVSKFKSMIHSMQISPFNRDIWSEKGVAKTEVKSDLNYVRSIL